MHGFANIETISAVTSAKRDTLTATAAIRNIHRAEMSTSRKSVVTNSCDGLCLQLLEREATGCKKLAQAVENSNRREMSRQDLQGLVTALDLRLSPSEIEVIYKASNTDDSCIVTTEKFLRFMTYIKNIQDEILWSATLNKLEWVYTELEAPRDAVGEALIQQLRHKEGSLASFAPWVVMMIVSGYYAAVTPLHYTDKNIYEGKYRQMIIYWEVFLTIVQLSWFIISVGRDRRNNFYLLISFLTSLPIDLVGHFIDSYHLRLVGYALRSLQLSQLSGFFNLESRKYVTGRVIRACSGWYPFFKIIFTGAIAIHWLCCLFIILSCREQPDPENCTNLDTETYVAGLYWTLYTISTVGYGDVESGGLGVRLLASACCVATIIINGILVGKITSYVMLDTKDEHRQLMYQTLQVISHYHLPDTVVDDILSLQHHLLSQKVMLRSFSEVVALLPKPVQESLQMYVKVQHINHIEIFTNTGPSCKISLAECLVHTIVNRDEIIVREGDVGNAMYFIVHGYGAVSIQGSHINIIEGGSFFGEMALVRSNGLSENKRAATVRTLTLTALLVLKANDFEIVTQRFPALKWHIQRVIAERRGIPHGTESPQFPPQNPFEELSELPVKTADTTEEAVLQRLRLRRLEDSSRRHAILPQYVDNGDLKNSRISLDRHKKVDHVPFASFSPEPEGIHDIFSPFTGGECESLLGQSATKHFSIEDRLNRIQHTLDTVCCHLNLSVPDTSMSLSNGTNQNVC